MLPTLNSFSKNDLVTPEGLRYKDFRRTLEPDYKRVWADLLAGHAGVALSAAGLVVAQGMLGKKATVIVPIGAAAIGFGMAYIHLFFHEAAHYNLAPDKSTNDLLANLFVGSLVGLDIATYRPLHWEHHRKLGTTEDTERTYFDPLDARFVIESLTGLKAIKVMLGREKKGESLPEEEAAGDAASAPQKKSFMSSQLVLGLVLHGAVVGGALYAGKWALAAGWVLGTASGFPFFGAVRQVLEHRSVDASPETDYSRTPHGETNRLFGDGFLARTFGAAGFNRHLLHHWDPQLSYTRLKDLEDFLMKTPAAPVLRAATTTYTEAFRALFGANGAKRV